MNTSQRSRSDCGFGVRSHRPRAAVVVEAMECRRMLSAALYRITDLGTLGGDYSQGNAINSLGHVAAESALPDGSVHAALFSGTGGLTDLGSLSGDAYGLGINRADQVVGYGDAPGGKFGEHAFVTDAGSLRDLGTLGGPNSHAFAINDGGDIVGDADAPDPNAPGQFFTRPAVWRAGAAAPEPLDGLGGHFGGATAINQGGVIVGYSAVVGDFPPPQAIPDHAFLYDPADGSTTDLGTLPGGINSEAYGVNDRGWVVGTAETPTGPTHAFLYRDGHMSDLGTLAGGQSFASGINNDGLVVGDALVAAGDHHAFLYDGQRMRDLNDLIDPAAGWTLEYATAVNGSGLITGVGTVGGAEHAYLLTPLPPPPRPTVRVTGFSIVNAATGRVVRRLANGDVLSLSELPRRLNVVANIAGPIRPGSVVFGLDARPRHIERAAPYALFGDNRGRYEGGTFARGRHTLTARAFARPDGTNPLGPALTVSFTVVR